MEKTSIIKKIEENSKVKEILSKAEMNASIASGLEIKTIEDEKKAIELGNTLNGYANDVDKLRKFFIDPYNAYVKNINGYFKPTSEKLKEVLIGIRRKLSDFHTKQETKAEEKKEKIIEKVEMGKMDAEKATDKLAEIKEPTKTVKTEEGSVSYRITKRAEITDLELLPKYYMVPDMKSIENALRIGKEIPGARLIDVKTPSFRRQ